jgi:serine/threonine-protein kinase
MSTSPGSLEGKYEVIAKIREGGMGAIYKVRHRLLNELRVIKVMRPEVAQSAEQRKRFLREAQTATRLRHPNIVAFYDFFVDEEDTAYMVMEYIEGINLRDMIKGCGAFPVPLGIDLSRQCLAAFEYLHRRKIVHRDVSPDNIMMTREEDGTVRAKLIDLGIAKIAQASEELTAADEFIGKLRYSSPEQLTKSASSPQIDGRSDLFSLGIVVYEILTGVCPYGGESLHEIIANRLREPPLAFDVSDPHGRLPPALKDAVLKALRLSPEGRYQTAAEFSKALEAFAEHGGDESRQAVERCVNKAMTLAAEAAHDRARGAADLGPTLKTNLEAKGDAGLGTAGSDLRFRSTIAKWSATTPPPPVGSLAEDPFAGSQQESLDRSAGPARVTAKASPGAARAGSIPSGDGRRRSPFAGYAAVALSAALLVGFGVWISGRDRGTEPSALSRPSPGASLSNVSASSRQPSGERSAPAPGSNVEREPSVEAESTPAKAPVTDGGIAAVESAIEKGSLPPAVEPKSTPKTLSRPRPTPAVRIAGVLPTKPPARTEEPKGAAEGQRNPRSEDAPILGAGPKMRYCPQFEDTVYKQGVTRDVPAGFEGIATKAPRPDSGLMRVSVSVSKERPADDESFFVVVRFENGGDARVDVQRLEESSSRGGMRPVGAAAVPVSVSPGGMKELYRYPLTLSGGEPYSKQFVVSDAKGDSWKAGVRIVPCD